MFWSSYSVEISMEIIIDFHNEILHWRNLSINYIEPDGVSTSVAIVVTHSDFDVATVIYFSSDNITIFRIKKR